MLLLHYECVCDHFNTEKSSHYHSNVIQMVLHSGSNQMVIFGIHISINLDANTSGWCSKPGLLCSSMSLMFLLLKLWKFSYDFESSHHMSGVFCLKSFRMQIVLSTWVQMVVNVYIQLVIRSILSSVSGPCSQMLPKTANHEESGHYKFPEQKFMPPTVLVCPKNDI